MARQQVKKLDNQIIVRMDTEIKEAFMNKAREENKSASEVIMGWIRSYLGEEPEQAPDLAQMQSELQTLKEQVAMMRNEFMGKLAA